VAGPRVWNRLLAPLRLVDDFVRFKRLLVSYLFHDQLYNIVTAHVFLIFFAIPYLTGGFAF